MFRAPVARHKSVTIIQTVVLMVVMIGFLALLGMVVAGIDGVLFALIMGAILLLLYPTVDPSLLARLFGARPLTRETSGMLYGYLDELSARAELASSPNLYMFASDVMTAFTVGKHDNAAIILSSSLIDRLTLPELVAVTAHEVAHITNRDLWLMSLSDIITRLTSLLSVVGQTIVLLFLPFYFLNGVALPWAGIIILIVAPAFSTLLQLSLSRVREYDADLTAAYLTGEPEHLISALSKIEYAERSFFETLFIPARSQKVPSLFRTHPPINERIEKLAAVRIPANVTPLDYGAYALENIPLSRRSSMHALFHYLLGHWH